MLTIGSHHQTHGNETLVFPAVTISNLSVLPPYAAVVTTTVESSSCPMTQMAKYRGEVHFSFYNTPGKKAASFSAEVFDAPNFHP